MSAPKVTLYEMSLAAAELWALRLGQEDDAALKEFLPYERGRCFFCDEWSPGGNHLAFPDPTAPGQKVLISPLCEPCATLPRPKQERLFRAMLAAMWPGSDV